MNVQQLQPAPPNPHIPNNNQRPPTQQWQQPPQTPPQQYQTIAPQSNPYPLFQYNQYPQTMTGLPPTISVPEHVDGMLAIIVAIILSPRGMANIGPEKMMVDFGFQNQCTRGSMDDPCLTHLHRTLAAPIKPIPKAHAGPHSPTHEFTLCRHSPHRGYTDCMSGALPPLQDMPYDQNYDLYGYQDQYSDYYGHHAHYVPYGTSIYNIPTTMGKTPLKTPKFAGKQTESVSLFFRQFENVAKLQRMDVTTKLGMLSSCLMCDAAVWAASLPAGLL